MKRLTLCLTLIGACTSTQVDQAGPTTDDAFLASFPDRTNSGITTRQRTVVTDQNTWSQTWESINRNVFPAPPVPTVDFGRETVVVAAMGERRSGGFVITIDSARVEADTVVLTVTESTPGPTCINIGAFTAPVAVARILRPRATVRFVERTAVTDCG
jgi:hypothetical protein